MKKWLNKKKIILIALIIFLAFIITFLYNNLGLGVVREYVQSFGVLAPIVLFVMIVLASSIGFIFQMPVAVAALLLDIKIAFLISIAGLAVGATISFFISRYFFRSYVERKYISKIKRLKEYDHHLYEHGFLTILFLRLIAVIPFELINIAGGLSRVKFSNYIFATVIGIIPGTIMAIYFARSTEHILTFKFLFALLLNICFSLLPLISRRVRRIIFRGD